MSIYIRKSHTKNKKYDAILPDAIVPFGQLGYEHYKDTTPLKLYSKLDHNNEERRRLFRQRFSKLYEMNKNNPYSSIFWSWNYLW